MSRLIWAVSSGSALFASILPYLRKKITHYLNGLVGIWFYGKCMVWMGEYKILFQIYGIGVKIVWNKTDTYRQDSEEVVTYSDIMFWQNSGIVFSGDDCNVVPKHILLRKICWQHIRSGWEKRTLGRLRSTQSLTSLRIRAVWYGSVLLAIQLLSRTERSTERLQILFPLYRCTGGSEAVICANVVRSLFVAGDHLVKGVYFVTNFRSP